jgi:hypothetical protein
MMSSGVSKVLIFHAGNFSVMGDSVCLLNY